MNAQDTAIVQKAMGLVPDPVLGSTTDLIRAIVESLKKLGDKGVSGARDTANRAHLAGVLSNINFEITQNAAADKIISNNATQAELDAKKAAANKAAIASTLGSLS